VHAHPAPRASTDEQVARAFLEAKGLADVFARLGVDARPALAWRCAHVAEALTAAVNETLGGGAAAAHRESATANAAAALLRRSKTALVWMLAPRAADAGGLLPFAPFLWPGRPVKIGLSTEAR